MQQLPGLIRVLMVLCYTGFQITAARADMSLTRWRHHYPLCVHLFLFLPVRQIECSSISEYSERIIKSNHLDSGKTCRCLRSLHSDTSAPRPQTKAKAEVLPAPNRLLRIETGRPGGTHRPILKCTI